MDRTSLSGDGKAVYVTIIGRVQGVGFRPYLYQLAEEYGMKGTAQNNMDGVKLIAEGSSGAVEAFLEALPQRAPRLSRIDRIEARAAPWHGYASFSIIASERSAAASSLVLPVDSAVCPDCLAEMSDPSDPRYRYPFITCTQCGPRYTIIRELPYDRPYTSMAEFPLCQACSEQYADIRDRRHHAQPIACAVCGPSVTLHHIDGSRITAHDDAVRRTQELLREGAIVAVKGLGGYHLACDATNAASVRLLRERKQRPRRPLAVMARDLTSVERVCFVSEAERTLLASPEAPIVVLRQREAVGTDCAPSVSAEGDVTPHLPYAELAPQMHTLGVMLPYTPLHHLLFAGSGLSHLVMTSANPSGLPLLYRDEEAFAYLRTIADYVLTNNRAILHPVDDSVVQLKEGALDFFRRARGYAPDPLSTVLPVNRITALGGQQKSTFALGRNGQIIISPHIGDLNNLEVERHWRSEHSHLAQWMGAAPDAVALDLHPGYETKALLSEFAAAEAVHVQHHHAHLVSCMEDNQVQESCYGLILDGTGYGEDGCIWGFELLYGDASGYSRLGHLRYTPLPGGEVCIRQPWRTAAAMLLQLLPDSGVALAQRLFPARSEALPVLAAMLANGANAPLAGTCGRLFDAAASLLGLCETSTYDGEAAIVLSELAAFASESEAERTKPYPYAIGGQGDAMLEIDFTAMLEAIASERLNGYPAVADIAVRFHETVAEAAVAMLRMAHQQDDCRNKQVALSGGSFHNRYLSRRIKAMLEEAGFTVLQHRRVPCNDGGLSLGQLAIASRRISQMKGEIDHVCGRARSGD